MIMIVSWHSKPILLVIWSNRISQLHSLISLCAPIYTSNHNKECFCLMQFSRFVLCDHSWRWVIPAPAVTSLWRRPDPTASTITASHHLTSKSKRASRPIRNSVVTVTRVSVLFGFEIVLWGIFLSNLLSFYSWSNHSLGGSAEEKSDHFCWKWP